MTIRVFRDWKLLRDFEWLEMKDLEDVKIVYDELVKEFWLNTNIEIHKYCEEPMQYILREYWFLLRSF